MQTEMLSTRTDARLYKTFQRFVTLTGGTVRGEIESATAVHIARRCLQRPELYTAIMALAENAPVDLPPCGCLVGVSDGLKKVLSDSFIERFPRLAAWLNAALFAARWEGGVFGIDAADWPTYDVASAPAGLATVKAGLGRRTDEGLADWPAWFEAVEKALRAEAERRQSGE